MKALLLLLLASPAFGQVTYVYTGTPLTVNDNSEHLSAGPPNVTAQIVLSVPLAPNQANQIVTPVSFYFLGSSGDLSTSFTGTINGLSDVTGQFSFDTANGVIVAWHITAGGASAWTSDTVSVDSSSGDAYDEIARNCGPSPCAYAASTATPGTWTYGADLVAQLQKQLTHVTSEMTVYRNGVVNWEAQALAWQARAYYWCKAAKGSC
jgi:hypothetical protein